MIAWKLLLDMLPREVIARKNEVKLEITLKNGSEISLKGADNEDNLRGAGIDYVVLDEYSIMKPNVWQEIIRPMLVDTEGSALFIGTPKGKNHFWELWLKGQRKEDGYESWSFRSVDNPYVKPEEIEQARKQCSEHYFKQEYEASFEDFTGLIYPEFDEKLHVIEPIELPEYYESLGAIDTAISGTTASLFGRFDEDMNLYIVGEYYEQNKRVSEVSEAIRGRCKGWVIDPASKIRTQARMGQLFSLYDEYLENGVSAMPAENDVDAGINRVAEYFKSGRIKIFNTCRNLINELGLYHWAEEKETVNGILKPKPYKAKDHACDCLRYLVMTRSKGVLPEVKAPEGSMKDFEEQLQRYQEHQRQLQEELGVL